MDKPYHALVVEDDTVAREATVAGLEDQGFQCQWAADGTTAALTMERSHFDVVVTDLRLPRRNGHSLAVELAGRARPRPLVIVLTGVLEPRLVKDLIGKGVDDVDFKPIDFRVFGAKVRALCDRQRRLQQSAVVGSDAIPGQAIGAKVDGPRVTAESLPMSATSRDCAHRVLSPETTMNLTNDVWQNLNHMANELELISSSDNDRNHKLMAAPALRSSASRAIYEERLKFTLRALLSLSDALDVERQESRPAAV